MEEEFTCGIPGKRELHP